MAQPLLASDLLDRLSRLDRTVVLVGLMGAGKTRVGSQLARVLGLPFVDSDHEIEKAAGMRITDIFDLYGEPAFREVEMKVIDRLLQPPVKILATGGGAFIQDGVRGLIKSQAVSIWLKADLETLVERTARSTARPLLQTENPAAVLDTLMQRRYPVYAEADVVVESAEQTPAEMVKTICEALATHLDARQGG